MKTPFSSKFFTVTLYSSNPSPLEFTVISFLQSIINNAVRILIKIIFLIIVVLLLINNWFIYNCFLYLVLSSLINFIFYHVIKISFVSRRKLRGGSLLYPSRTRNQSGPL